MFNFYKKKKNLKFIAIERTPFKELEIYFSFIDRIKKNIDETFNKIFL